MPHIAIVMPGAHGHINPTIAVARELTRQGARVSYLFTPLPTLEAKFIKAELEATGATVHPYPSHLQFKRDGETPRESWAAFPRRILEDSIDIAQRMEGTLRELRPDLIVHDFLCLAGRFVGHALGLPTLTFFPTYPTNQHFPQSHIVPVDPRPEHPERLAFRDLAQQVVERWGLPPFTDETMFVPSNTLNIVFMPREFHPAGHSFDSRYLFVGPSLQPRIRVGNFSPSAEPTQPLYYVSLGTLFSKQPAFFRLCLEAFSTLPGQVVMSIGDRFDPALLGPLPDNATVRSFVDQLEILSRCSVFVTHGGMNSVMESLHDGVPMVVVPQIPEQVFTAKWLTTSKLGVPIDPQTQSVQALRDAVLTAQSDAGIADNIRNMQQIARQSSGYRGAAAAILAQAGR